MPIFLVPKFDNGVHSIIDFSLWTVYIVIPYISLKTADDGVCEIPPRSYPVKIDLKFGFYQ